MNEILQNLVRGMSQQSVQIAAVFGIVIGATWLLRGRSAHWRYLLWLVVPIKCMTPHGGVGSGGTFTRENDAIDLV